MRRTIATYVPFYYGWIILIVASFAMTATLPGRTHGLGLITKPLIDDATLGVSESEFSKLNFWAILIGSAMCLPIGWLIDRVGVRLILTGVSLGLGGAVVWMSRVTDPDSLFIALVLIRGLGQGALSIVSMAMIGKWFSDHLRIAMAVFTVLLSIGFILSTVGVGVMVKELQWREAWGMLGWSLIVGMAPLGLLLVRSTPESVGVPVEHAERAALDLPLSVALTTPAFWAFTAAAALFNLMWSAITLFNQSIMAERGFNNDDYLMVMGVLVFAGLPSNLLAGWLAGRWPMGRIAFIGMAMFAVSLIAFPFVSTKLEVGLYAFALGVSGGIVTVLFFTVYVHTFGRAHLGAIQAFVQMITVFASALGPVILTMCKERTGSYTGMFTAAAPIAVVVGCAAWYFKLPQENVNDVADGD